MSKLRLTIDDTALKTREDLVADAIRTSILRGTFRPGAKLDQQQIADELNVSRSPVREALRTLGAEGLVTIIPNRSAVVTERSLQELEELYFIRVVLEGAAVERAAPKMVEGTLKELASILEQADDTYDLEELLILNNDFHIRTYSAFQQPILLNYIQQLRNMVAPYNRLYLDLVGSKEAAWADHRRIYEACVRRDGKAARSETQNHLEQVFRRIVESQEDN
jgi:DNA-binding GntR family transcriptional regulator